MRILCISSQVAYGPVGNTAAVPALQAMGHEVLALPTILLSNHPGHGTPHAIRVPAHDLAATEFRDQAPGLGVAQAALRGGKSLKHAPWAILPNPCNTARRHDLAQKNGKRLAVLRATEQLAPCADLFAIFEVKKITDIKTKSGKSMATMCGMNPM